MVTPAPVFFGVRIELLFPFCSQIVPKPTHPHPTHAHTHTPSRTQLRSRRIQMMFPLSGPERKGLVSLEAKRKVRMRLDVHVCVGVCVYM